MLKNPKSRIAFQLVIICLLICSCCVTYADVQEFATVEQENCLFGKECRIIIIYSDPGECKFTEIVNEEKQNRNTRINPIHREVFQMLEKRVNNAIREKVTLYRNRGEQLLKIQNDNVGMYRAIESQTETDDDKNDDYEGKQNEVNSLTTNEVDYDLYGNSVKLKSHYLETLSMDITVVSDLMTPNEVIALAEGLPCIDFLSRDYIKTIPSILTPLHSVEFPSNEQNRLLLENQINGERVTNTSLNLRSEKSIVETEVDLFEDYDIEPENAKVDKYFSLQWHLLANEPFGSQVQNLWNEIKDPSETVVAVLDSGCSLEHRDLKTRFWINPDEDCHDGVDNDNNGFIDDCHGWDFVDNDNDPSPSGSSHGTSVSGIIAAEMNNGIGIAGVCPGCKIMCLRFIGKTGGRLSDEIAALNYAVAKNVRISNNSFGGYGISKAEYVAIKRAHRFHHLFVSSSGNDNQNTDDPNILHSPSGYGLQNILSIGSNDRNGQKSIFSNWGVSSVHVLAPGSQIVTTLPGDRYGVVYGTSFSAPIVTGIVGMILSVYPTSSTTDLVNSVVKGCNKSASLYPWCKCGGIVNSHLVLQNARAQPTGTSLNNTEDISAENKPEKND